MGDRAPKPPSRFDVIIGWALLIAGGGTFVTADPRPPDWASGLMWLAIGMIVLHRWQADKDRWKAHQTQRRRWQAFHGEVRRARTEATVIPHDPENRQ